MSGPIITIRAKDPNDDYRPIPTPLPSSEIDDETIISNPSGGVTKTSDIKVPLADGTFKKFRVTLTSATRESLRRLIEKTDKQMQESFGQLAHDSGVINPNQSFIFKPQSKEFQKLKDEEIIDSTNVDGLTARATFNLTSLDSKVNETAHRTLNTLKLVIQKYYPDDKTIGRGVDDIERLQARHPLVKHPVEHVKSRMTSPPEHPASDSAFQISIEQESSDRDFSLMDSDEATIRIKRKETEPQRPTTILITPVTEPLKGPSQEPQAAVKPVDPVLKPQQAKTPRKIDEPKDRLPTPKSRKEFLEEEAAWVKEKLGFHHYQWDKEWVLDKNKTEFVDSAKLEVIKQFLKNKGDIATNDAKLALFKMLCEQLMDGNGLPTDLGKTLLKNKSELIVGGADRMLGAVEENGEFKGENILGDMLMNIRDRLGRNIHMARLREERIAQQRASGNTPPV